MHNDGLFKTTVLQWSCTKGVLQTSFISSYFVFLFFLCLLISLIQNFRYNFHFSFPRMEHSISPTKVAFTMSFTFCMSSCCEVFLCYSEVSYSHAQAKFFHASKVLYDSFASIIDLICFTGNHKEMST